MNFQFSIFNFQNKGFSLVELMISITIIGILTTVVIQSLNNSRIRAYDAKIKEQLSRLRSSAEIYYSNQEPNGYIPAVSACDQGMFADTSAVNGSPAVYLNFAGVNPPVTAVCQSVQNAYAIKATLASGGYFCVDSRGTVKSYSGSIGTPMTQCPP